MQALTHDSNSVASLERGALDRAIERGLDWLQRTQAPGGEWQGDYGGPLFLLPMYMGTCYGTGVDIPSDVVASMLRYMRSTQRDDGGWGLHVESHSYMFTSVLNYAAMRLFGVPADDPAMRRARAYIQDRGGPLVAASWGKFFLSLLNLYDYRGLMPIPPETWLLPERSLLHPSRLWCQARMTYLPMSFLYARRVQMPVDANVAAIRAELYTQPYDRIRWQDAIEQVAASDAYTPLSSWAKWAGRAFSIYEKRAPKALRQRALDKVLEQIRAEDRNTQYVCLNPIIKCYNMWVWHHLEGTGAELAKHVERLPEYLWHAEDGTKVQGYHSSQLWDTAFAVQAILATGEIERTRSMLESAHGFVDRNQVRANLPERERSYRDPTKGGWGFSNKDNGWIVSDTTAEGLRASLALRRLVPTPLSQERFADAVDYLLWSQTDCGGWASYEPTRGPRWLEKLNVSSVFGEIMIDYPYVECSAAALLALSAYAEAYPGDRAAAIARAVARGRDFLLAQQRPDGSFEGSWGICFTYGTWFGVEGLRAAGLPARHERIARACDFLEQHQLEDGGWGETAESCYQRRYVHARSSQAVMTSWALLALIAGGRGAGASVARGVEFLIRTQRADGTYPSEHIAGMFNKTCAIHYDNYLKIFPLWALGAARAHG